MFLCIPLITYLYLKYKKITLYIKNYNDIILKALFLGILSFFIINSQHVIFSLQLISNDLTNQFTRSVHEVIDEKKQEALSKIVEKINNKKISNQQIEVYIKDNETHLIIKDLQK